jgi:Arc-like DNA binding domain
MRKGGNLRAAERDAALERGRTHARISFGEQRPIVEEDAAEHMTPFSLRLKASLKQALEVAAQRRGHSLNSEINRRLEHTFREEDAVGGAAMLELTRLWAAAFLRGGGLAARALDHPEWGPDEWLSNRFAYKSAVHAAMDALLARLPPTEFLAAEDEEKLRQYLELEEHLAIEVSAGAALKIRKGSAR